MAEPKAYEPEKLTSGVTWKWKKTISDYPASEWTLTYYLRKDGATATSFSATADGDTHLVTVAAATMYISSVSGLKPLYLSLPIWLFLGDEVAKG